MVVVVAYDPSWPQAFACEAGLIEGALGPGVRLHHIGSTSVPGLAAKPVIDVLMEVACLAALDGEAAVMEALGYEVMGAFGIEGRRYFRKDDARGLRTHQIHAFETGSPHLARHLAFRDYLRAHGDVAAKYGALKLRLAETCADAGAYMDGKDGFVKRVEGEAVAWSRHQQ